MKRNWMHLPVRLILALALAVSMAAMAHAQGNMRATGEFTYESPFAGETYAQFNAIKKKDGSVTGYLYSESASGIVAWQITHMNVVGNTAYMSAYDTADPTIQMIFIVQDGGEGANAADDKALGTLYFIFFGGVGPPVAETPGFYAFLNFYLGVLGRPLTTGNIQVNQGG